MAGNVWKSGFAKQSFSRLQSPWGSPGKGTAGVTTPSSRGSAGVKPTSPLRWRAGSLPATPPGKPRLSQQLASGFAAEQGKLLSGGTPGGPQLQFSE